MLLQVILSLLSVGSATVAAKTSYPVARHDAACQQLKITIPSLLDNITIYSATHYPDGTNYTNPGQLPYWTKPAVNLSAFCLFGANVSTSSKSQFRFEIFLPDEWNGRFMMVGNGGDSGWVANENMALPMTEYGFAVASTNTGHDGSSGDGSFARDNIESAIDFGYRAVHLTTVFSKEVVKAYYGKAASYSYWNGCSAGGKQGLKEVQMFPADYDGVLAGAPAAWTPHLNGHQYWRNIFVNTLNTTRYISPTQFTTIKQEVLRQCDALDGLVDGIISRPTRCTLDYSQFGCNATSMSPVFNSSTCLTADQLQTYITLRNDWHSRENGELLFPAHQLGTEEQWGANSGGIPYGVTGNYFDYQVLNYTENFAQAPFVNEPNVTIDGKLINETQLEYLVRLGDQITADGTAAFNPNITGFVQSGGKLIHYHGGADGNIPTGSSLIYRDRLLNTMGDVSDNYRFYEVPGLLHCVGGVGPVSFGQANAKPNALQGVGKSLYNNATYNIIYALMDWVENGTAPNYLIGAQYNDDDINHGVNLTRKICPYPQTAQYMAEMDPYDQASFFCA